MGRSSFCIAGITIDANSFYQETDSISKINECVHLDSPILSPVLTESAVLCYSVPISIPEISR